MPEAVKLPGMANWRTRKQRNEQDTTTLCDWRAKKAVSSFWGVHRSQTRVAKELIAEQTTVPPELAGKRDCVGEVC